MLSECLKRKHTYCRIDVHLNFIMHKTTEFNTNFSPTMEEGNPLLHPPPWCTIHYLTETPPPSYCNHMHIRARIDVNLNFIMHPKPGFSTQKNHHRGNGVPHPRPLWFPIFNHFKKEIFLPTPFVPYASDQNEEVNLALTSN